MKLSALILTFFSIPLLTGCGKSAAPDHMMNHGVKESELSHFSVDTTNLSEAKPSQIIALKSGDSYDLTATIVKQTIGNRTIKRLAYNGMIPGPLLKVPKGAEITVKFKNEIDVDSTIHSHGLRLDNAFDGVPGVTQAPVKPGETFSYQLKFPDEGIYWYHPHIREDYAQELGLYGSYLVEPDNAEYWQTVDREEFLILDDILVNENQPSFPVNQTDHALMGRFGNIMLINNEEDYQLELSQNEVSRMFITNVSNTRPYNFSIEGARIKLVGGDVGRIEKETFVDSIIIAPAERYILEIQFDRAGTFEIQNKTDGEFRKIGSITVKETEEDLDTNFSKLRENPQDYEAIRSEVKALIAKNPDKELSLSIDMPGMPMMNMMDHGTSAIEWEDEMPGMNAMSNSEAVTWKITDTLEGKENMDIDWIFEQNDLVKIRIFNDPESTHPMQHPIHFHGQRFVILAHNGILNDNFQWKDTALIPTGDTMDLLVEMSNPGTWMAHCHIAEHLHSGMMFGFKVMN